MNTTLTTDRRLESAIQYEQQPQAARRVSILDRAALQLGIALIKWGRRPGARAASERRVTRAELALLHRERQFARASLARDELPIDYLSRLSPMR